MLESSLPLLNQTVNSTGRRVKKGKERVLDRGAVIEVYRGSTSGVEKEFLLLQKLPGQTALALVIRIVRAIVTQSGNFISMRVDCGRRLDYSNLRVFDAQSNQVPGSLVCKADSELWLTVDNNGFEYPLGLDRIVCATNTSMRRDRFFKNLCSDRRNTQ